MATVTVTNNEDVGGVTQSSQVSDSESLKADARLIGWAMAAVIAAAVVMWLADRYLIKPTTMQVVPSVVPYFGVLAVTAALERFLEPISGLIPPWTGKTKDAASEAKAVAQKLAADVNVKIPDVQDKVHAAAATQAVVDKQRFERTIVFWAIASICGLGISGGFGLFLLQSIATSHVNSFLDLTVTGLAIGAGTKPVHDAIIGIQKTARR